MSRALVCVVFALIACGGSNNGSIDAHQGSGSGNGSGSGSGNGNGSGSGSGSGVYDFGCADATCTLSQVCCTHPNGSNTTFTCDSMSSCPAADKIACDGPDECGGTTPVCCGVAVGNGQGSYPSCQFSSLGTSCTSAAACPTHLQSSCSDTTKVQICHVSSECTDSAEPKCCTFSTGGSELTFCTDATTAAIGQATCH